MREPPAQTPGPRTNPQGTVMFHFLEREHLAMIPPGPRHDLRPRLERLARLALLFSDGPALIPAPGIFETEVGYAIGRTLEPAVERGQVAFHGGGADPWAFAERKLQHFPNGENGSAYEHSDARRLEFAAKSWRVKSTSTDSALVEGWQAGVEAGTHPLLSLVKRTRARIAAEETLYHLPAQLEGRAIIADHLIAALPEELRRHMTRADMAALRMHLATSFYASYARQSADRVLQAPRFPDVDALVPEHVSRLYTPQLEQMLGVIGLDRLLLDELSATDVAAIAHTSAWRAFATEILDRVAVGRQWSSSEVVALSRVRRPRRPHTPTARKPLDRLRSHLVQLLDALAKTRLVPGVGGGPSVVIRKADIGTIINIEQLHAPAPRGRPRESEPENAAEREEDSL